jgi:hypothetical protein
MVQMGAPATKRRTRAAVMAGVFAASCLASLAQSSTKGPPALASTRGGVSRGAQVGFAAGETDTQCLAKDPSFCPRNTTNYTPAVWSVLRASHAALYMNIEYMADFGPPPPGSPQRTDVIPLVRTANELGVPIVAWITLPVAEGTFFDEQNASLAPQVIRDFHAWVDLHHLGISDTMLDLEIPTGYQQVSDALAGNLSTLEQTMRANIDPVGQCRAMTTYRDTISWAHQHGMVLSGTPVNFSIDDLADGNMGMQDALDMPAYAPAMYDHIWVQAYRTEPPVPPGTPADFDFGSGYVAHYYKLAQHYLGPSGQVGIGNIGIPPYNTLGQVVTDIRMLAGMGATSLFLFDFDATVNTFGLSGLQTIIQAGHNPLSGAALAAAEGSVSAEGNGAFKLFSTLNQLSNTLTLAVTTTEGHPRQPNAWPGGCGPMRPAPLR